ncbi:hypothetical protein JOD63_000405 [Microbacterium terrae]|uniref:LamG-like jellyroll fold domain-containing protein n=1 Tax=Microbacterium terrae TaxID=69369 RepID=UPI001470746C|nr:LamG-like jellyroll fold domain-containing protein [Microbacterium terrae]MBP1076437.1 hypothetical protein [Microbacterium terrae]
MDGSKTTRRGLPRMLAAVAGVAAVIAATLVTPTAAVATPPGAIAHYPLNSTTKLADLDGAHAFTSNAVVNPTWTADYLDLTASGSYLADNAFAGFTLSGESAATFAVDVFLPVSATGTANSTLVTYGSNPTTANISVRPFHTADTAAVTITSGGTTSVVATFPALRKGVWQNIAISFASGSEVAVFVDGDEVARAATTRTLAAIGNGVFRLNRNATVFTNVASRYRDLLVYDRALTPAEATDLAAANAQFAVDQVAAGLAADGVVYEDLDLPAVPGMTWSTSDADVVTADGIVTRPSTEAGDAQVTLTVSHDRAGSTWSASREFTVPAIEVYDGVPVGETWYDTAGDSIQAHGGGFLEHDGVYYWAGEDKSHDNASFNGVNLYRSDDLLNWTFVDQILSPDAAGLDCGTKGDATCKVERPKLIYNESNDTFVLYGHWEVRESYGPSQLVAAVSSTGIDGEYTVLWHERPGTTAASTANTVLGANGYLSRDFTAYVAPDGTGYIISAQGSGDTRIYPLSADYTKLDIDASYPITGHHREAPAITYIDGFYYLFTSAQSGWYANQTVYVYTDDLTQDVWSDQIPVGNNTSFKSQPTNIMSIGDESTGQGYVYMGDRWTPEKLGGSTYVWLPIDLGDTRADGSRELDFTYMTDWSFDAASGEIVRPDVVSVSAGKTASSTGGGSASPAYGTAAPTVAANVANDGIAYNLATQGSDTHFFSPTLNVAQSVAGGGILYDWQVDLGGAYDLDRADIAWRNYNGSEPYSQYLLYGSVDGAEWTVLKDNSANRTVGFTSDDVDGRYRHVRLEVLRVFNAHNGNSATWASGLVEVDIVAHPDTAKPVATLVTPATAGPFPTVQIQVDATDDVGLKRIVANIYQGKTLVKSTQTPMAGALAGSHSATVTLPDGSYTVRYNAEDLAGHIAATGNVAVTVDATRPTATVKEGGSFTVGGDGSYDLVSFKLYDAGKIDKVSINGVAKDLSDNAWSDVNFVKPGVFGAVSGENTLVVHDVAGNTQTVVFTLR